MGANTMKRRGFLKLIAAAPVAALPLPAIAERAPEIIARYTHRTVALGFAIDDGVALNSVSHLEHLGAHNAFAAALRPGLEKIFDDAYAEHSQEWADAFDDDSLEDIELDDEELPIMMGFAR